MGCWRMRGGGAAGSGYGLGLLAGLDGGSWSRWGALSVLAQVGRGEVNAGGGRLYREWVAWLR